MDPDHSLQNYVVKPTPFKSAASMFAGTSKGKSKMYEGYAFCDNGTLNQKAIEMLDSGALLHYSPVFGSKILDLEAPVANGLLAKDILHYAVQSILGLFENVLEDKHPFVADITKLENMDLMPVNSMLSLMDFENSPNSEVSPPKKKVRRAASVWLYCYQLSHPSYLV